MNILYICDEYPPGRHGGIGTAVRLLAREVAAQGHNVVVAGFYDWGYGGEDEFMDGQVKVYRFRRGFASTAFTRQDSLPVRLIYRVAKDSGLWHWDIKRSLRKYKDFIERIIKQHAIDIIEMADYNDYMRFCKSYVPFPEFSVPTIVKMHGCMTYIAKENGKIISDFVSKMEAHILQQATAVCSVSRYNATKTVAYLHYNKPVEVLYNGIEIPKRKVTVNKDLDKVIFTGSLSENKGVYQLMKAWNIVSQKLPGACLYLYGKGPVEKVAAFLDNDTRESVYFKGHVSRAELMDELATAAVAIFPSFTESFSMAPMEAMIAGTATIFTKRASGPELITDGVDGLLVDPSNVDEMASSLIKLLENPELCERLAIKGKELIRSKFNIVKIAHDNIGYYENVLATILHN